MPVPAPADKRFRRAQVRPGHRAGWRRHWRTVAIWSTAVIVVLAAGAGIVTQALTTPRLAIDSIAVRGNQRMSTGEVHALIGNLLGANVLLADLDGARERLKASPWVADVDIRRHFPSSVSVELREKAAAAVGRIGSRLYLVDHAGEIIDDYGPGYVEFDLPVIDGLGRASAGSPLELRRAALVAGLMGALRTRPDLARRISQIDVSDPRNAVVMLRDDPVMVRIGSEQFVERLQSYLELAQALRDQVADIDYVDLRYGERVFVKPQRPERPAPGLKGERG